MSYYAYIPHVLYFQVKHFALSEFPNSFFEQLKIKIFATHLNY